MLEENHQKSQRLKQKYRAIHQSDSVTVSHQLGLNAGKIIDHIKDVPPLVAKSKAAQVSLRVHHGST